MKPLLIIFAGVAGGVIGSVLEDNGIITEASSWALYGALWGAIIASIAAFDF